MNLVDPKTKIIPIASCIMVFMFCTCIGHYIKNLLFGNPDQQRRKRGVVILEVIEDENDERRIEIITEGEKMVPL